jgi:hypothetical protein
MSDIFREGARTERAFARFHPVFVVRLLVALGWVAAGFLYELGVTLEWEEVRLLRRWGVARNGRIGLRGRSC